MGNHQIIITFSLFLLLSGALEVVASSSCAPSSCGALRSIKSPFRLSGEPRKCGEIELSCEGEDAAIYLEGTKYFVKEILNSTWDSTTWGTAEISVVYAGGFSSGYHGLRSTSYYGYSQANTLVNLMKCSQRIDSTGNIDDHYLQLPSFTNSSLNTTVYAKIAALDSDNRYLGGQIVDLRMSCSPLGWFWANSTSPVHSEDDLLQAALNTFPVTLFINVNENFGSCLRSAMNGYTDVSSFLLGVISYPTVALDCIDYKIGNKFVKIPFGYITTVLSPVLTILAIKRFTCVPLVVYVLAIYNFRKARRRRRIDNVELFLRSQQRISPTRYAYSDLIAMTNNFTQKLGQGGFGSVFKGHLQGVIPVAVKVLGASKLNGEEFISEVSTIGRIHHLNVVRLLGFCSEGSKRALIYEYMPNGSLDKYIFATKGADNNNKHATLTLEKRNEIALGVARGIHYLHHGCEMQILHFDIKPHNILLDSHLNPKVSDFGLAKLYPKDYNSVSVSAARGTIGYMAPELISRSFGVISYKSDVYSFGMLLMEMAGQRRNVDHGVSKSNQIYYPSWIYDKLVQLQVDTSVPDITPEIDEIEVKLCKVGLWCIQMKPSNRPSMSKVVSMLQGNDADEVEMPPKPFFSSAEPSSVTRPSFPLISFPDLSMISEYDDLP